MSPHIARRVLEMFKQHVPPPRADYNLTERECEVLGLLTQGDDYKQIADKLHVHSKSQAVATALKERIVSSR